MNNKQHDRKLFEDALNKVSENSEKTLNEIIDPISLAGLALGGAALAGGAAKFYGDVKREREKHRLDTAEKELGLERARQQIGLAASEEGRRSAMHPLQLTKAQQDIDFSASRETRAGEAHEFGMKKGESELERGEESHGQNIRRGEQQIKIAGAGEKRAGQSHTSNGSG
jgi:hypothetical protein